MNCANHPDRERVAFCQNCGKPLCSECSRTVGNAVFCEPCLAARLAAADAAAAATPYGNVNTPYPPPPAHPGAPNPALAGLLGLIPGVGAMYNGQYAKGGVHLVIFAVLVSLSHAADIFGLFVAGWIVYQVIEAHHTARARRDGTPLPNPFGLNDIGERLGFGKSWPAGAATPPIPPTAPYNPNVGADSTAAGFAQPAQGQSFTDSDGNSFTQFPDGTQTYVGGDGTRFTQGPRWGQTYTAPPVPPVPPYGMPFPATEPLPPASHNRFPAGALLLIGLGILFFIGSSGAFHRFPTQRLIPFFILAIGVWIFVGKMTSSGLGMTDDGSPAYRLRLFRALRGSIWVILVGVLFFLDTFDILSWAHSWPLFIIVAGLMMVFRGSAYASAPPIPYPYPTAGPAAPYAASEPVAPAIVSATPHDEEGR
jgi:hypothetical protein